MEGSGFFLTARYIPIIRKQENRLFNQKGDIPMRILIKVLTGILWSIFFFVGSIIVGALVASGLSKLLSVVSFFNPASISSFSLIITRLIIFSGTIAGFYIGYSRTLKKVAKDIDNKVMFRKLVFLVILFFIIGIPSYIIYINIRVYNRYGYYVHVTNENVFDSTIDPKNPKIIDHGRLLQEKIIGLDEKIDDGDGKKGGKIRWFECYGIDCDESWESRSYK